MVLRHFRRELHYNDLRRFKLPSEAGPGADCSLVRRYLSNSHLLEFKTPHSNAQFAVRMLAALVDRNFSVDTLRLGTDGGGLSDYRSIDAVFDGRMRLNSLELSQTEDKFASLVKTTDFFRMPTVQSLKSLKIWLTEPWEAEAPRRWAIVSPLLWISGIHQLHSSERFEVEYESSRYPRIICLKLVHLCEKFERGEISEFIQHFKFTTSRQIAVPFKDDNKTASEVKVGDYEWDIYRFRNAATGERLTACVGFELSEEPLYSVLHIVTGDAFPDASFAA